MNKVTLLSPGKLVFGDDALEQFVQDFISLGHKRLYLVTIPPIMPQIEGALSQLEHAGVQLKINDTIAGEPSFDDFERLLKQAREFEADGIVGLGGGSVLDVAKLLAAQLSNQQSTNEVKGIGNLKERNTYLACLPTTSGTGSEVSPNAIFVDETGAKIGVISPFLVPDGAYIDPKLTTTVPAAITAATGIDALAHCLEAYANNFAHPVVDLFALEGIRLIAENLLQACRNGDNIDARAKVALGSMYGGMCLGPVNTAAAHALSYPLGVSYHISHGLSVALLLPFVMEYNLEATPGRYAQIALALGAENQGSALATAKAGIARLRALMTACGLTACLSDLDIPYDAISSMATDALKVQRLLKNNVRTITQEGAEAIYRAAYNKL